MSKERLGLILKITIPTIIGIGVVIWLFGREFNINALKQIRFTSTTFAGLGCAFLFLFGREFGMAWRFRTLTDSHLSWKASTEVTLLCEFTSAITPTSVGGSALSMVFLSRKGIRLGRATAITLTTLFLDELFFVICCPLLFLFMTPENLFGFTDGQTAKSLMTAFWIIYGLMTVITTGLFLGLFFMPDKIAAFLSKLFSLPLIKRWKNKVIELGDNLMETSAELKNKPWKWWIEPAASTVMTWTCRFLIVNALFFAFIPTADQITVLGRQFIVWALLIFTPTPGGSGVSELLFKTYYSDIVSGPILMVLAVTWRLLTYYIFLLIGFCMIPSLLKLTKKHTKATDNG